MSSYILRQDADPAMTWVFATLIAASLQTGRTALQQRLRGRLSTNAAGFVRYAFGAPFSLAAVAFLAISGVALPSPSATFMWRVALGGLAQILGTFFLITAFQQRDFAIGTIYSKSESLQVALISWLVLGEGLGWGAWVGMAVLLSGVALLATKGDVSKLRSLFSSTGDRAMWSGIAAGAGFAVAAICIRSASKTLGDDQPIVRALITLAVMNTLQVVMNGGWMLIKRPAEFAAIGHEWKSSALVGFLSVTGSAGWAIGMTLHNAAAVRAVGQVDAVLALIVGSVFFHEQRRRSDFFGTALVISGVLLVTITG